MVRSYILTDKQREKIKAYIEELPERMPGTIRGIRHVVSKIDLQQMLDDVYLLKTLQGLEMPIGRSKGEGWVDQRGKFIVRPSASADQPAKVVVRHKEKNQ
ncbi:hypothetical protein LCGC14_0980940 [marine sediment metagenome]|uniref:Uncharacterized protein n=1 Tax=marine sediment metagenome TaxID=412755 RepID=A0A0F9QS43_9ZZZZ